MLAPPDKLRRLAELRARERAAQARQAASSDVFALLGFTPNDGPQSVFLSLPDENLDVLYGGAAGGGKTQSLLVYALRACVRFPGLQAFWFRRTFPELEQSVLRMLARYDHARVLGARYSDQKHELRFANGSVLTFAHAKNSQEAAALLSAEINLLLIDERTTLLPGVVDMLYSRVRSGVPGVPCLGVRSATNPGGVGHSRVKSGYIEATGHGEREVTDEFNRRRVFIQARLSDTPQLGEEYRRNLQGLGEKLRRAYEEGDWEVFEGQMFGELSWDRHVVAPFTIPASWRRHVGVDWGFAAPWAVGWWAVDEDGRVWLYRERYETHVGEADQARRILADEGGEQITSRWADDAMWATRGDAKPIAQVYAEEGVHLTPAGKGPGSRVTGWQRLHTYLGDGPACHIHRAQGLDTCPWLHVFTTCPKWFDEVSALPHATAGNPEDADPQAADHHADQTRYVLVNLGTGPQMVSLPDEARQAPAAADLLAPMGTWAVRNEHRPGWAGGDPPDRGTQPSPFT